MRAYLIRRFLLLIPTLFLLTAFVFLSVRFIPGDVIDVMSERSMRAGGAQLDREAMEKLLGLDQPVHVQYANWIGGMLLHGTFGTSLHGRTYSIEQIIARRLPITMELGLLALVIALVIALPVGVYSAMRQDTAADYVGRSAAIIGLATPNFWLGMLVIVFPSIWWQWQPPLEHVSFRDAPLRNLGFFIIPAAIVGTAMAASTMRMTRTMMLEVLRQDYVRTAWVQGAAREGGGGAACDQERLHSRGHPDRPGAADPDRRVGDHRKRVQHSGARAAGGGGAEPA